MRLPPIKPSELPPQLRALHDAIDARMGESLSSFVSKDENGALIGPFPALLHFPEFGQAAFAFLDKMVGGAALPALAREVAILAVGARFKANYELYSHERMAGKAGLGAEQIAAVIRGDLPPDVEEPSTAALDYARAALEGPVSQEIYDRALRALGHQGVGELSFLVGGYSLICVLLNGFDVPVPATPTDQH